MVHPTRHWQSTWSSSTENIYYPLTHMVPYFWQWVLPRDHRGPFPFLVLLGFSDVALTLLWKGWWQKWKEKLLSFFYHLLLSTQSSSLLFTLNKASKEDSITVPFNSYKPSLPHSILQVSNFVCHLLGFNKLLALYLLKVPKLFSWECVLHL